MPHAQLSCACKHSATQFGNISAENDGPRSAIGILKLMEKVSASHSKSTDRAAT